MKYSSQNCQGKLGSKDEKAQSKEHARTDVSHHGSEEDIYLSKKLNKEYSGEGTEHF